MPHIIASIANDDVMRVIAQLSIEPPTVLLVFVHGWGGDAQETWRWSDRFLLQAELPDGHFDALFYGYDSVRQRAAESAGQLQSFLDEFITNPVPRLTTVLPEPAVEQRLGRPYHRIVVCCHSLGAPVARRALLDIWNSRQARASWLQHVRLLLFAPAHHGAHPLEVLSLMGGIHRAYAAIEVLAQLIAPSLGDLKPNSKFLTKLLTDSTQAIRSGGCPDQALRAYRVFWKHKDKVVHNEHFLNDEPQKTPPGTTHTSICKADSPESFVYRAITEAMR